MEWEPLFQRWEMACGTSKTQANPDLALLIKEARMLLEHRNVPAVEWVIAALEGSTETDQRRRNFLNAALYRSHQMSKRLVVPMLRAAIYERDPSFNKAFILPCLRSVGARKVNDTLLGYLENGTDTEKAGAASAFYWSFGLMGRDGVADENIDDIKFQVRCRFLSEFVGNPDVRVKQRIVPSLQLNPDLYPEALRPMITQAIDLARHHEDKYIRHRIEIQLGSGGPYEAIPD